MGGRMVYDGSIIQDGVALGQGYGIQDQCVIQLYPRGDMVGPVFHSCPASSSDVRKLDETPNGVQAILDSGAAQSLFADDEGNYRYADGNEPSGHEADPSGQLTLPEPLEAGGPAEPPLAAVLPPLDPVIPAKAAAGKLDEEGSLTPVVVTRTNVYQVPPETKTTSHKLLPTAKAVAKAAAKAGQPGDQGPPTCKREGCDHPSWNGKAGFYRSTACKDKDCASKTCEAPGCVNARYEGSPYCSLDCMEKDKAKKAEPGANVPNIGEPATGPMISVIQSNVAGKNVGGYSRFANERARNGL